MKPTKQAYQLEPGDVLEDGRKVERVKGKGFVTVKFADGTAERVSFCKVYTMAAKEDGK